MELSEVQRTVDKLTKNSSDLQTYIESLDKQISVEGVKILNIFDGVCQMWVDVDIRKWRDIILQNKQDIDKRLAGMIEVQKVLKSTLEDSLNALEESLNAPTHMDN